MSKFNNIGIRKNNLTINNEGHIAFKMELKELIVVEALSSFFGELKFYNDNTSDIIKNARKMIEIEPAFIANLAIYSRCVMNLRSISHVLAAELAHSNNGKKYVREVIREIVKRPDDMTEILSYYINNYGKPIPNSLKKGIADSFVRFDEYSLAKYNSDRNQLKLKDILCLVHPKAKNKEQNDMYKRLIEGKLEQPLTWQTKLSDMGNTKEAWEELIASNKLGYMAILRNLKNILKCNPSNIDKVYEILSDKDSVLKSKQLPFRFYSAYNTLYRKGIGTSKIYSVLEEAIKYSTSNIDRIEGKTFIAADVSGSMTMPISRRSEVTAADIAVVMMSIANYICEEAITGTFSDEFKLYPMSTSGGIITNARNIPITGLSTNMIAPLRYLIDNYIYVDRIIILSDNEASYAYRGICQQYVDEYRCKVNPDVWVHAIDMAGYGTQQFWGKNVNIISGWSENIFRFISSVEDSDRKRMLNEIEDYYFKKGDINYEGYTG